MVHRLPAAPLVSVVLAASIGLGAADDARADKLAEFLFWNEMGNATGNAVQSFNDYQRERQEWRDNIAAAEAALERCGGCAEAQAELDKWQGVENEFNEFAGGVFSAVGMPPIVARALDITMPLAPYRPPEERARECAIVRPAWVAERSDFCQAKVDEYLTCLTEFERRNGVCTSDTAKVPGAACWWQSKFYRPCYDENYTAVELEQKIQDARAAGHIIPDYANYGDVAIVAYGRVPDQFVPPMPPLETVEQILEIEFQLTREIKFRMEKSGHGSLRQATIKRLHWSDVAPNASNCFEPGAVTDEIELRVCEDLSEMSMVYYPVVLACYYVGGGESYIADALYWYTERPTAGVIEPTNLLQRSGNHPLLQVAGARTDCPATLDEASRIGGEHRRALASLDVDEVDGDIAMRSGWKDHLIPIWEAQRKRHLEGSEALRDFPIVGTYEFDLSGAWGSARGRCTITRDANTGWYSVDTFLVTCLAEDGSLYTQRATFSPRQPSLLVEWNLVGEYEDLFRYELSPPYNGQFFYRVDVAARQAGDGDILETTGKVGTTRGGRLIRTGEVDNPDGTPIEELAPLRGAVARFARELGHDSLEELAALDGGWAAQFDTYPDSPRGPGANWQERRDWARQYLRARLAGLSPEEALGTLSPTPPAVTEEEMAPSAGPTGKWTGSYKCGTARIGLELTLQDADAGSIWGIFAFSALPDGPRVPSGRFYLWGSRGQGTEAIELSPGPWIEHPDGWQPVGLTARLTLKGEGAGDASTDRMTGEILFPGCYGFEVARVDAAADSLGDMPPTIRAALAAAEPKE